MSEEELDAAGALAVDEDQDEVLEDLSLEERKERLKKARWNVFLYLGVAAILFGFALFPMPFSADYDSFTKSSEKDIGFVWGLPVDGPDLFDVPLHLTVAATAPPKQTTISIAVYVIEEDDCTDPSMGEKMREAKTSDSHAYQYQVADEPVFEETDYEFEFNIDPGHYCLITEYIHGNGTKIEDSGMELSVDGKLYPNQFFAGVAGLACLSLSALAFLGAQRHGGAMRKLLEGENESTESKVLSEASRARIAAGPGAVHRRPVQAAHRPVKAPASHQQKRHQQNRLQKHQSQPRRRLQPQHPQRANLKGPSSLQKTAISSEKCRMGPTTRPFTSKTKTVLTSPMKADASIICLI